MVRRSGRPRRRAILAWVLVLGTLGAGGIWLWQSMHPAAPRFRSMMVTRNGDPIRLLNGEALSLRPDDRIRIRDIETNILFNPGVRIFCSGLDANAFLYEEMELRSLLPKGRSFDRHEFRVEVKRDHAAIGHVLLDVEPSVEDWLAKAARIIDHEKRRALLVRAADLHPEEKRIREQLIKTHMELEDWSGAAAVLEKALEKEPRSEPLLRRLLTAYESGKTFEGILLTQRRILDLHPEDVTLRYRFANGLEEADRTVEAATEYERVLKDLEDDRDRAAVLKTLGYLYARQGAPEKAIDRYEAAVELDPQDTNLYYNLAGLYDQAGRKDRADGYLKLAVSKETEDVSGRLRLAEAAIEKGNLEEAEAYLQEILAQQPDSMDAMLLLVNVLDRQGDRKRLIPLYRRILEQAPGNPTLAYNLAVLEYETGEYEESASHLQGLLKSTPQDVDALELLFNNLRELDQRDEACRIARKLLQLDSPNLEYTLFIAGVLVQQERYDEMIPLVERGLKEHPKHGALTDYLILGLLKTNREDQALVRMEKALETRPKDMDLMTRLAELADRRGKPDLAIRTYRRMLRQAPGSREILQGLVRLLLERGRGQESSGNREAAFETYGEIINIAPGTEEAEEGYLRLRLERMKGGT